jgi:hypothetical protein
MRSDNVEDDKCDVNDGGEDKTDGWEVHKTILVIG